MGLNQHTSESTLYSAGFGIVMPALVCAGMLQKISGVVASIVITITLMLWARAGLKTYKAIQNEEIYTPIWNAVAFTVTSVVFFKVDGNSTINLLGWVAAFFAFIHAATIFYIKNGSKALNKQREVARMGSTTGESNHDEAFYLREEQKLIAHEGVPVEPKRDYQNKAELTKANFKTLIGMEPTKKHLYTAYREMYSGVTIKGAEKKNGIMLSGDPGNGKTAIAEALAGHIGWPIIKCSFADVNSRWVGETTENVVQLFNDAMEQAPCVLFIDEIDSLLVKRDQITQAESETGKTVNAILTKLVEVRDHMVLVVAATNYPDRLDPAAVREGRFDYKIEIPCPDLVARKGLLLADLKKHAPALTLDAEAINRVAIRWEGFSVSRIKAVAFEAAKLAKSEKRGTIDFDCLAAAMRTIQGVLGDRLPENAKTLDQMHFDDDVRTTLNGLAVRMRDIDEIERLGGSVPSGALFSGPPGTGKTATVRALAKASGWALLTTSGKDLNAADSKIDEIYAKARNIRPCIVFIDEADDILADRQNSWNKSMTNKLLSVIDGAGGKSHDILWIAATNHPESIDQAALRGGRFTEKIEFRLPSIEAVEKFVRDWDEKNPANLDSGLKYNQIAALLHGQSIANIEAIMQASVNRMIARTSGGGERVVTRPDLQLAYASVVGE